MRCFFWMWIIMAHHNFLFFVTFSKVCLYLSQSIFCPPFKQTTEVGHSLFSSVPLVFIKSCEKYLNLVNVRILKMRNYYVCTFELVYLYFGYSTCHSSTGVCHTWRHFICPTWIDCCHFDLGDISSVLSSLFYFLSCLHKIWLYCTN